MTFRLPSVIVSSRHRRWLLTGGIGSGKSEVRRMLESHGIRVVDADAVGHSVLENEGFEPVSARWPQVVVEGVIDRKRLASVVFADPQQLTDLEAITHPLIFGRIGADLEGFDGVAVVEMPLIDADLGWPSIVVDAADEVRIQRAVDRGMDEADARRRMGSQPTRAEWLASAEVVIPNFNGLAELERTVAEATVTILSGPITRHQTLDAPQR